MTNQTYIQEIAYKLWEAAGRPEGQDVKYWNEASALVNTISSGKGASPEMQSTPQEKAIEPAQPDQT